jgi:hypothetical protein
LIYSIVPSPPSITLFVLGYHPLASLADDERAGYDGMAIPRVKGERREVRRMLARRSQKLLQRYRRGEPVGEDCPLERALAVDG